MLELPGLATKGDVRDWLAAGGTREQLDALVEQAPDWQPPLEEAPADKGKARAAADEQALIDELARLNAVDYDRRRDEAADQMRVRRGTLDNEVERTSPRAGRRGGAAAVIWSLAGRALAGSGRYWRADPCYRRTHHAACRTERRAGGGSSAVDIVRLGTRRGRGPFADPAGDIGGS